MRSPACQESPAVILKLSLGIRDWTQTMGTERKIGELGGMTAEVPLNVLSVLFWICPSPSPLYHPYAFNQEVKNKTSACSCRFSYI